MTESSNPFATEEAWEVSGGFLPAGDHICTVRSVDGSGTSSGGHPQIEVEVGNDLGTIRDWIVVIPSTVGKVTQLTDAVGLDRPTDEQVKPDGSGFRLDPKYLARMINRRVGVLVRPEPDQRNPGQTRDRVRGYVDASKISTSDVPIPAGSGFDPKAPTQVGQSVFPSAVADDDIPF
jgi:hypothetical protein